MSAHRLPPLASLLKSRDVEDPVNVWLHRPLAYSFVWATWRTTITPNQVTLLATVVGLVAAGFWFWGTPTGMVIGGFLLWTSAILDGADGILARAKKMASEFGRAIDGSADMVVGLATTAAAFYQCYVQTQDPIYYYLAVPAVGLTVLHVYTYDFYKESYLRMTRVEKGGEGGDAPQVAQRLKELEDEGADLFTRLIVKHGLLKLLEAQHSLVSRLNPRAIRQNRRFTVNEQTASIYRRYNLWPIRLWAIVSVAPHTYTMAMCAIVGHIEWYLWIRLFFMNAVFLIALVLQRRATHKTMDAFSDIGAAPVDMPAAQLA